MKASALIGALVATLVLVAGYLVIAPSVQQDNGQPLGADSGPVKYEKQEFEGGVKFGRTYASTSQGSAITMSANEFRGWGNSDFVSYAPGLNTQTITFPASSSVPDFLPQAGDTQKVCINNATSTANTLITFAGSVGIKLQVASSSATAVGSTKLATGKYGCFTFIRDVATSSGYDISALYEPFN